MSKDASGAPFSQKAWLDSHVIPWLGPTRLALYSVLWNGNPPADVLVFLLAGTVAPPPVASPSSANENQPPDEPDDEWAAVAKAALGMQQLDQAVQEKLDGTPKLVDPAAWPVAVKQLLDAGFRFDFLREVQMVPSEHGLVAIFGGDGTPQIGKNALASVRLWRRIEGVNLIVQIGCTYPTALDATAAVKAFFALFDDNPVKVCQSFAAPFGAA